MRYKLPPLRSSIIPKKGFKGSTLGILYAWLFLKLKIFGRAYLNKVTLKNSRRSILKKYYEDLKDLRRKLTFRGVEERVIRLETILYNYKLIVMLVHALGKGENYKLYSLHWGKVICKLN